MQAQANPFRMDRASLARCGGWKLTAGVVISEQKEREVRGTGGYTTPVGAGPSKDRAFRDTASAGKGERQFSVAPVVSCEYYQRVSRDGQSKTPLLLPVNAIQVQVERSASSIGDSLRFCFMPTRRSKPYLIRILRDKSAPYGGVVATLYNLPGCLW